MGVSKRQMADRLPVGEPRFVHFGEPGTTLQPGAWAGPTQVMVVEHRSDETSLIIRPFLDADEDDPVNEPGDLLENMVRVPSQKIRAGQNYKEQLVFDVCPTKSLPASLEVREPPNAVTFDFANRKGDSMSLQVLRSYCPQKWRPFFSEEVNIGSPSPARSGTGSGGGAGGVAQQLSSIMQAIETLTVAQTKSLHEQQAMKARMLLLEQQQQQQQQPPAVAPPERLSDRGTGAFTLPGAGAPMSAEARAMVDELRRLRPTGPVPAAHSAPSFAPPPAPAAGATGAEEGAEAAQTMLQRATVALEVIAGSGEMARVMMPKTKRSQLFKLEGARGRVAQDELNAEFESDPAAVVAQFEAAVKRLKTPDNMEAVLPSQSIVDAWREHVPAREHALVMRVSEAILNAYCALRAGNIDKGKARLVLLLAALEQHTLDGGKWAYRAEHLLGMPPAPQHLYHTPPAETKPKAEKEGKPALGPLAKFCAPERSTTALGVFKENTAA